MFELLRDFIKGRFLRNADRYEGLNQFNRHGILHGVFDDYGEELNFYRTITIIDLLCMIIGYRQGGVSMFAPVDTDESRALAGHYVELIDRDPTSLKARYEKIMLFHEATQLRKK